MPCFGKFSLLKSETHNAGNADESERPERMGGMGEVAARNFFYCRCRALSLPQAACPAPWNRRQIQGRRL